MRDASQLKQENAEVYYKDEVGSGYDFIKGTVLEHKTVNEAKKDWDQRWSRKCGTILKIAPKDSRVKGRKIRYRHLSSVLSPEQYKRRQERAKEGRTSTQKTKGNRKSNRSSSQTSSRRTSTAN